MKNGLVPVLAHVHFSSVVLSKHFSLGVAVPQAKLNNTPLAFGTKSLIQSMCLYGIELSDQAKPCFVTLLLGSLSYKIFQFCLPPHSKIQLNNLSISNPLLSISTY